MTVGMGAPVGDEGEKRSIRKDGGERGKQPYPTYWRLLLKWGRPTVWCWRSGETAAEKNLGKKMVFMVRLVAKRKRVGGEEGSTGSETLKALVARA